MHTEKFMKSPENSLFNVNNSIATKAKTSDKTDYKKQTTTEIESRELKCIHQRATVVSPKQQYKVTNNNFGSAIKRFFTFKVKKIHQPLEYQNNGPQKNIGDIYSPVHNHQNLRNKVTEVVYRRHPESEPKYYNSDTYYLRMHNSIQAHHTKQAHGGWVSTDKLKKKSVTNQFDRNLKSKSTQSKILKKYSKPRLHRRNGRTTRAFSSSRPIIQNITDRNHNFAVCEPTFKHQRSKLCCASPLESNLVECCNNRSDQKAEIYPKRKKSRVGIFQKRRTSVGSNVNTRMRIYKDVNQNKKDELHKEQRFSKSFRSSFKTERSNSVNQSILRKENSDALRKAVHFGSNFHTEARILKQGKRNDSIANNDKTYTLTNNSHICNVCSQMHYKTPSRATGVSKLLRRCFYAANMRQEIEKRGETEKVVNNLKLKIQATKQPETANKPIKEPKEINRPTKIKEYNNVAKDDHNNDKSKEGKILSININKRLNKRSQTFGINYYPKHYAPSILSESYRTSQPKEQYKSRKWSPDYCVLQCRPECVKYGAERGICVGKDTSEYQHQQGTGDGYVSRARYRDEADMDNDEKRSKNKQTSTNFYKWLRRREREERSAQRENEDETNYGYTGESRRRRRRFGRKIPGDEDEDEMKYDYTDKSQRRRRGHGSAGREYLDEDEMDNDELQSKNTQAKRRWFFLPKSATTGYDNQYEGFNRERKEGSAKQTDKKELKTIMAYSKKKYNRLTSRTKLSHNSTNTSGATHKLTVRPTRKKIVINENDRRNFLYQQYEIWRRHFRGRAVRKPAVDKPVLDLVLNKQMRVLNKDTVFPIVSSGRYSSAETERRGIFRRGRRRMSSPPVMEIHVDKTTASVINSDEILCRLREEKERKRIGQQTQQICRYCKTPYSDDARRQIGLQAQREGRILAKLHGRSCSCCICREYRRIAYYFSVKPRRLKPCVCGSHVCSRDLKRLKTRQEDLRNIRLPPYCVCGSDVCKYEFEKMPARRLKEVQKKRRQKEKDARQRISDLARMRRNKAHRRKVLKRFKKREAEHERQMDELKKIENRSMVIMAAESIRDLGLFGCRFLGDSMKDTTRYAKYPKDAVYNLRDSVRAVKADPSVAVKKAKRTYKESGLRSTLERVRQRCIQTRIGRIIKRRLERHAITNYLLHITDPNPRERLKKVRRKRHKEPVNYDCNLYMNSLRTRPFLRIYRMCPWFYPHCVSLFGLWKQLANVLMFLLAICVWSPCILCFEACRALTCCFMCTGYDF